MDAILHMESFKENIILQENYRGLQSREIFGETETMKMVPRRDQSRGLESRLQALVGRNSLNWLLCHQNHY